MSSEKIDLSIDRITPNDAEVLIWLQDNMVDKNHLQQKLHKVIESENVRAKYLSYLRNDIEQGNIAIKLKETTFLRISNIFLNLFHSELRDLENANTTQYHESFPAALIIYRDEGTAAIRMDVYFSGNSLHSLAATLNLISNFELQLIPNGNYRIRSTNAPMHRWVSFWMSWRS